METIIVTAITSILSIVETVLPAISGSTATPVIITIVTELEKWIPIVVAELPNATALFTSIKNAINALSSSPATPQEQLNTLQQLDAQVDTAFEAIATKVDPDLPTGDPLAKSGPATT